LAIANTPTEALITNPIPDAAIVVRNKSRKKMKKLPSPVLKPEKIKCPYVFSIDQ